MDLTFLGATGTVTGSRYLLEHQDTKVLVDCGLFQGVKQLRLRNREPFPVRPSEIDAVILTHAHLDHSGYLPLLVRDGFTGPIYCTEATADLCEILLRDSGHLQEEEAEYANRAGYSRHHPALPLYTEQDAVVAMDGFHPVPLNTEVRLAGGISFVLRPAGHLLGAASVFVRGAGTSVLFSGDLGRPDDPILPPPVPLDQADYVVVESTYGDRSHDRSDPLDALEAIVKSTARRGGTLLIPSFAVGRAQHIAYLLHELRLQGRIPALPTFLDSPMAGRATQIYLSHAATLRVGPDRLAEALRTVEITESVEDSKRIDAMTYPRIVISASGMATGGRVLHHLKAMAPDPRNTILFAGYQAAGTRGAIIVGGAKAVKIHGGYTPIRAQVAILENLSAHADAEELMEWLSKLKEPVRQTFVTHGEPVASDTLRRRIEERLRRSARVPEHGELVSLGRQELPTTR